MKAIVAIVILFSNLITCFAQRQVPDKLEYDDITYSLQQFPLEEYFLKHSDKKPKGTVFSASLSKQYVATFELRENFLFLKDLEVREFQTDTLNTDKLVRQLDSILGSKTKNYRYVYKSVIDSLRLTNLKVDWLTTLLVLPYGKKSRNLSGYDFDYENYLLLEIKEGQLLRNRKFTHEEFQTFKSLQYENFKRSSAYIKEKRRLMKHYRGLIDRENCENDAESCLEQFCDGLIRKNITEYTSSIY